MLITALTAGCLLGWFTAAAGLLASSRSMAMHDAGVSRRHRAALVARATYTSLLVLSAALAILGAARHGGALAGTLGLGSGTVAAAITLLAASMFLAIITLWLPDLPGRATLRQMENVAFWVIALLLAAVFVLGVRGGDTRYAAAGALSLCIAFTMAARAYLRGATVLVTRIGTQGSHPGTEATLKRLLRRCRPFIVAAAAALALMCAFI